MNNDSGRQAINTEEFIKMDLCLKNIYKMRQDERDLSDYHMFIESANSFLKVSSAHDVYVKSLSAAIKKCKNQRFLAILYEICSLIKAKSFFISRRTLEKHFKVANCRPSIIKCVNAFNLDFLDQKIVKCFLQDKNFIFPSIFDFITRKSALFIDFMHTRDRNYIYKQLEVMINCKIAENLSYFARFLGCESKITAFKTFEALNIIFQDLEQHSDSQKPVDSVSYEGRMCLELSQDDCAIEDPVHFLSCGFEFIRERSKIIECASESCNQKTLDTLNSVLCKYGYHRPITKKEFSQISLCFRKEVASREQESMPIGNFDFLFLSKSRKDICDCYEF